MPRDLFCFHCGQHISVADDLTDQTILCPHCGTQIPAQTNLNPLAVMHRVEPSEPVPTPFTIGEFLQDACRIGIKCWLPFLFMGLIVGCFTFVFMVVACGCMIVWFFLMQMREPSDISSMAAVLGVALMILLIFSLIMVWLYGGQVAYSLAIVRGEKPPVSVLFSGRKYFWRILIAGANITVIILCTFFVLFLLFMIPVYLLILCGLPNPTMSSVLLGYVAIIVAAMFTQMIFCLTYFFIVDRHQGPVQAMMSSYRCVCPQFWRVFGSVLLISIFTLIVNSIWLVGIFLLAPVVFCFYTVLYLKITGQRHGLS